MAVACIESEVPAALSRWCDADRDSNSESADSSTSTVVDTKASTKATAHAATPMLPRKGGVHVAITDESYHPRQLLLVERAKETLRGVALYTVDSSCVCPVNTYRSGQASVSASTGANESSSRKKFRQTQVFVVLEVKNMICCTQFICRACSRQIPDRLFLGFAYGDSKTHVSPFQGCTRTILA